MKKRLLSIVLLIALFMTLLPASVFALDEIDGWVYVRDAGHLKDALATTYVNKIKFANHIMIDKKGIVINEKKTSLTIDGNGYTLTDYPSNSSSDAIRLITSSNLKVITIQNMDILGMNSSGSFWVRDSSTMVRTKLIFRDVNYTGPHMVDNPRGTVEIHDSTAFLHLGYSKSYGEVAEASNVVLGGNVEIAKYQPKRDDEIFKITKDSHGGVEILPNANVTVDNAKNEKRKSRGFAYMSVAHGKFIVGDGATLKYDGFNSFIQGYSLVNASIGENAYVYVTTKEDFSGCDGQIEIKGDFRVGKGSTLRMVAESNKKKQPILQLKGTGQVVFDAPKEVLLANSSNNKSYKDYFLATGPYGCDVNITMYGIKRLEYWHWWRPWGADIHNPENPSAVFENATGTFNATFDMRHKKTEGVAVQNYNDPNVPLNLVTGTMIGVNIIRFEGEPAPVYSNITVKHVYEDGTDIVAPEVYDDFAPGNYNFAALTDSNLEFVGMGTGSSPATGTITAGESIEIVFVYKERQEQQFINLEGSITWDGGDQYIPAAVPVTVYQNGVAYKTETFNTSTATSFFFANLPVFADDGSRYVYTVDTDECEGFVKTVNNDTYRIEQKYTQYQVIVIHVEKDTGVEIERELDKFVLHGGSITLRPKNFSDRTLIEPPSEVTYTDVREQPQDVVFYYSPVQP